jgi:beta-galactosidase
VTATIADQSGIPIPDASNLVSFRITGPGIIAAVDNGDNSSTETFHASQRHAYQGRCLAIIRAVAAGGKITLTASASGLKGTSITLR